MFSTTTCKLIRTQRAYYYGKRTAARQEPQQFMSLIVDGMDQNKTDLPHLTTKNKAASNLWVLRTHLTGAIVHGRRSYAFVDVHLWPQDSNMSMNIFLQILFHGKDNLPSTLYLQMDNCFRENKNQFFFGLLGLLVHYGVFKEVQFCTVSYSTLNRSVNLNL